MRTLFSGSRSLEAWNWGPGDGGGAPDLLKQEVWVLLPGTERLTMPRSSEPQPPASGL